MCAPFGQMARELLLSDRPIAILVDVQKNVAGLVTAEAARPSQVRIVIQVKFQYAC